MDEQRQAAIDGLLRILHRQWLEADAAHTVAVADANATRNAERRRILERGVTAGCTDRQMGTIPPHRDPVTGRIYRGDVSRQRIAQLRDVLGVELPDDRERDTPARDATGRFASEDNS